KKSGREFFSGVTVLRLQIKQAQIERYGFVDLLGRDVVVREIFQDRCVVASVFNRFFENVVYPGDFFGFCRSIWLENHGRIKLPEGVQKTGSSLFRANARSSD